MPKKPKIPVPEGFAELNLNQYVRVRLTAEGKELLKAIILKDINEINDRLDEPHVEVLSPEDLKDWMPQEDENGWSEWQLWVLMKTFAKYLNEGEPLPFETTLGVPTKLNRTAGWQGAAVEQPVKIG